MHPSNQTIASHNSATPQHPTHTLYTYIYIYICFSIYIYINNMYTHLNTSKKPNNCIPQQHNTPTPHQHVGSNPQKIKKCPIFALRLLLWRGGVERGGCTEGVRGKGGPKVVEEGSGGGAMTQIKKRAGNKLTFSQRD